MLKELTIEKNTIEILQESGLPLDTIEAIVWSHWHFDHTGDPLSFPSSTKLVVGPGFKNRFLPGYPTDRPQEPCPRIRLCRRNVEEVGFASSDLTIGRFKAVDYFGDGSFYLLDTPGHAIGHVDALARTHASPSPGFIHLAGDSVHDAAEIRPSKYLPLPGSISPSPLPHLHPTVCPGHLFDPVVKNRSDAETEHLLEFYDPWSSQRPPKERKYAIVHDEAVLRDDVQKDEEFDADQNILTLIAHDWSL